MTRRNLLFSIFLFFCFSLVTPNDGITDDQKEQPCCSLNFGAVPPRDVILRSSLDGKFSAIDAKTGKVLWVRATGPGPLLSSSISSLELTADGKGFRLVPSLDGTLFRFTGDAVEALPFSADSLLESSFQVADDTIITGGKEVRTYGIGLVSGRLHYVCTLRGCNRFEGNRDTIEDVLVVKRNTQTVRAVNPITGSERWNFSVGLHDVSLMSQPYGDQMNKPDDEPGNYDYYFSDSLDSPAYQFDVSKGKIFAVSPFEDRVLWEQTAESPIVGAWIIRDRRLSVINLFPRDIVDATGVGFPHLYLGKHFGAPYIHTSRRWMNMNPAPPVEWRPLSLMWIPRPHALKDPVLITGEEDEHHALAEVRPGLEYPYSGGFYTFSDDEDYSEDENGTEDEIDEEASVPVVKPVRRRPKRRGSKKSVEPVTEDVDDLIDDAAFGFLLYLHELSYWWRELLVTLILGIGVALYFNLYFTYDNREVSGPPRAVEVRPSQEVAIYRPPEQQQPQPPNVTMNIQNVVFDIRHGSPDAKDKRRTTSENDAVVSRSDSNESTSSSTKEEFKSKFLADFWNVERLGAGGFGVVFQATHKIDGCSYAVKRILLPSKKENREKVMREVQALAKLDHSNIVRYYHTWLESPPNDWNVDEGIIERRGGSIDEFPLSLETKPTTEDPLSKEDETSSDSDDSDSFPPRNQLQTVGDEDEDDSVIFANSTSNPADDSGNNNTQSIVEQKPSPSDMTGTTATSCSVFRHTEVSYSADRLNVTVNDLRVEVRSDASDCRALVPLNELTDPRRFFERIANADCGAKRRKSSGSKRSSERTRAFSESSANKPQRVYLYIQMQLCQKQTLKHWLMSNPGDKRPPKGRLLEMFSSIVDAVAYIHHQGLIHRDLKPSNIFFAVDGRIKVGDFGLVTAVSEDVESKMFPTIGDVIDGPAGDSYSSTSRRARQFTNEVGTKLYMSPEQIARKPYNSSVDVYSLGLILFELLFPLSTEMERQKLLAELKTELRFPAIFDTEYSEEKCLLERMVARDPELRPTAEEVYTSVQRWLPAFDTPVLPRGSSSSARNLAF